MIRNYQLRLYPNKTQVAALERQIEVHRSLYNMALAQRRDAWQTRRLRISLYDQQRQMTQVRKAEPEWFGSVSRSSLELTLRRLDKAYQRFFNFGGYPRFKSAKRFDSMEYRYSDGLKLTGRKVRLFNVGEVRARGWRELPQGAVIKCGVVKRKLGKWYLTFALEFERQPPPKSGDGVGLDMGISSFAIISTGERVTNPRPLETSQRKLRVAQRSLSRKKLYGANWRKQAHRVGVLYERVFNTRKDFHHKLSRRLANEYALVAVENLNIKGLAKGQLSKQVADVGWGSFLNMLTYKAEEAGGLVVRVSPHNTSQLCSGCGEIVSKSLSERIHSCARCGLVLDRDHNAALNILHRAKHARSALT